MNDKDTLQRFIFENASVRGELVHLEESYQMIMQQHRYPPEIQAILGQMLAVASLLSASIKFKGRITVQFQGKGKLKLLLAQSNHHLGVRGLAQWRETLNEQELLAELKQGLIAIIMDPDALDSHQRYQGIVAWEGDSLAESIEVYFKNSEQVPTRLWLAVSEKKVAGLLIQVMPRESSRQGKETEELNWEHLSCLSATITEKELLTLNNATLLHRLYVEEDVRLFPAQPIHFYCTCSVTRSENAIRLLTQEEVEQELHEKQQIVVTCEFCSKEFLFDRVDIARIFKKGNPDSSTQLH